MCTCLTLDGGSFALHNVLGTSKILGDQSEIVFAGAFVALHHDFIIGQGEIVKTFGLDPLLLP